MEKSVFEIAKMDCPSEENLIRLKLEGQAAIQKLEFDIPKRKLTVFHHGKLDEIEHAILQLNLGGKKLSTQKSESVIFEKDHSQRKVLWYILIINFAFFVIEITTGFISKSMGLVADSLDMLADAFVYALSLMAVGHAAGRKKRVATIAGYLQLTLALIGFSEVLRRFIMSEKIPDFGTMIVVSMLALVANAICLYLIQRSKGKEEVHMQASLIFTSNDIVINLGIIAAGVLVHLLNSNKPDLIVGIIVFAVVLRGAIRIIRLGK